MYTSEISVPQVLPTRTAILEVPQVLPTRTAILEVPQVLIESILAYIQNPIALGMTCKSFNELLSSSDTKKRWLRFRGKTARSVYEDLSHFKFTDECKYMCWNNSNYVEKIRDTCEGTRSIFGDEIPKTIFLSEKEKVNCLLYLPLKKVITYITYNSLEYSYMAGHRPVFEEDDEGCKDDGGVLIRFLKICSLESTSVEDRNSLVKYLFRQRFVQHNTDSSFSTPVAIMRDFLLTHQQYLVLYPWTISVFTFEELRKNTFAVYILDSVIRYMSVSTSFNEYVTEMFITTSDGLKFLLTNYNYKVYSWHLRPALDRYKALAREERVKFLNTREMCQKFAEALVATRMPDMYIKIFLEAFSYTSYVIHISTPNARHTLKKNSNTYLEFQGYSDIKSTRKI